MRVAPDIVTMKRCANDALRLEPPLDLGYWFRTVSVGGT
jgi:hypothetical protein